MKLIILAVLFFGVWALIENTLILSVRREKLGKGDIRIAHIADLHKRSFGKGNSRIIGKISAEKPDLILISGDLVSRDCIDFSEAEKLLTELVKIAPVYMVYGNHEKDLSDEYIKTLQDVIIRSEAVLLDNAAEMVEIRGQSLNICGLTLKRTVYKKDGKYRNLDTLTLEEIHAKSGKKPEGKTILLVHNPLFAQVYSRWGADFAVCGHVHGGVARIPFTRLGVLSPERKFFPRYSKGVYTIGRMRLLVSSGLGKLRLFNPPEIVIYVL